MYIGVFNLYGQLQVSNLKDFEMPFLMCLLSHFRGQIDSTTVIIFHSIYLPTKEA